MKHLTLIRHAQAESALPGHSDFDRLLTRRGMEDAAMMAGRLRLRATKIDLLLSSPAPRAKVTAEIFARTLKLSATHLDNDERLYTAGPNEFMITLLEYGGAHSHVAIAAHNPGITEFADKLSGERRIDAMPTCAVVTLRFAIDDWSDLNWHQGAHVELDYPGNVS